MPCRSHMTDELTVPLAANLSDLRTADLVRPLTTMQADSHNLQLRMNIHPITYIEIPRVHSI